MFSKMSGTKYVRGWDQGKSSLETGQDKKIGGDSMKERGQKF